MKKFNIAIVTIFTIILGTVLSACGFKQPSANFSNEEIFLSVGQSINLLDYLTVAEYDKENTEFKFSNSSFFTIDGNTLTAQTYGQANVYASFEGNTLDSMHIVVKKPFEQVENIQMDDNGLVTWNNVVDKFDETQDFTSPSSYQINITYLNPTTNETTIVIESVNTNSYNLTEEGRYTLSVVALGEGYFDNSLATETTLYFGYMPKLQTEDFSFDPSTEELTWTKVSSATFTITFNNEIIVENQTENSLVLTPYLSELNAGDYSLTILVNDENGEKISVESEEITISKIQNASVNYIFDEENGGSYNVTLPENAENVVLTLGEEVYEFTENSTSRFEGLPQGSYEINVQAFANASLEDGIFYANSNEEIQGHVYKLGKVSIQGTGDNEENDAAFNFNLTRTDENISTSLEIHLNDSSFKEIGFEGAETEINKNVIGLSSGNYSLSVKQITGQESVVINGISYNIVNSDESDIYEFTKLSSFSEINQGETISHSYLSNNSQFNFNLVEGATDYALYVQSGDSFSLVDSSLYSRKDSTITFNGKIENLFEDNFDIDEITFKLVAFGEEENVISSSTLKTLTKLTEPTSTSGNNESTVYLWETVAGAGSYYVRYALISKEQFDLGLDQIKTEELSFEEPVVTDETQITLDAGNYYYIEIFALPENESKNLTSTTFETIFYLSEKLATPNVDFMYGNLSEVEQAGYYIRVENVANMASFTVTLGQDLVTSSSLGEGYTIYKLNDDFSDDYNGTNLSVVAHSVDNTIYLDSESFTLTIKKLRQLQYAIENNDFIFDELTKTVTVLGGREGVTDIVLSDGTEVKHGGNADTSLEIYDMENGTITALLKGSVIEESGKLQPIDNTIYIDSDEVSYTIRRVDRPTNFTYNNGNLTFNASHQYANDFVLDMILTDSNENQVMLKISNLKLNNGVDDYPTLTTYRMENDDLVLILDEQTIESNLLTSLTTNNYSIDLASIISVIASDNDLNNYYSQAVKIEFGVYCYQNILSGSIYLNSYYGTLLSDPSLNLLEIEKMASPVVTYNKETSMLSWDVVEGANYVVYRNGTPVLRDLQANSYEIDLSNLTISQDYTFYVTATSPYYLESAQSNDILIHRLGAVSGVTLSNNNLQFAPNVYDNSYITKATVKVDSGSEEEISKGTNFSYAISSNGVYTIKYLGITDFESQGRFYLDSQEVTFNISEMTSIAPENNTVTFSNNVISFAPFGESANLQTLKYRIVFEDESGNQRAIETDTPSYTIALDDDNLTNLLAGEITINVYAILSTYFVPAGGNVYYSAENEDLGLYNVYSYTSTATLTKLATPTIQNIEFDSTSNGATATTPNIILRIAGNYSTNETFYVFIGDDDNIVKEVSYSEAKDSVGDGYTITLTFDEYSQYINIGNNNISVVVRSLINLPSPAGTANIYQNDTLKGITQNSDSISYNGSISGYNQTITIEFKDSESKSYATGGIDLVISYTPNGGESQEVTITIPSSSFEENSTSLTYDLSSFFNNDSYNLDEGGTISYSAYIRSFSDNNIENKSYFLASQPISSAISYEVLTMPTQGLERTNGGIYLVNTDSLINTANTVYVIKYGPSTYVVGQEDDFYFEFPSVWGNGEYSLEIYAFENGKIKSNTLDYSINLSRIEWVNPNVTFKRDENQEQYFEWNEMANATSYIVRAYGDDLLINEIEIVKGSDFSSGEKPGFAMTDIFGDNYSLLQNYGFTINGASIRFDLIACNHVDSETYYTDSSIYSVNATLIGSGNNLVGGNISVSEEGVVYFTGESGTYLYTLADIQQSLNFEWKEKIVASENNQTKIDLREFTNLDEDTVFTLKVLKKGSATLDGVVYNTTANTNLQLDSITIESLSRFKVTYGVKNVAFDSLNVENLTVALNNENSRVFVSNLSATSELDLFNLSNLVEISLVSTGILDENNNFVYNINYTEILDSNLSLDDGKLYFYALQENLNDYLNTLSFAYEFEFTVDSSLEILSIEKMAETGIEIENDKLDRSKTQMVFAYDENIVGFYFRVDYTSPTEQKQTSKFTYSISDCTLDLETNQIILDLSLLFSDEEVNQCAGTYDLSVSILKTSYGESGEQNVVFTNYITTFGDTPLTFTKLPDLYSVNIENGNLVWRIDSNLQNLANMANAYYIYLLNVNNQNAISKYKTDSSITTYNGENLTATMNEYQVYVIAVANSPYIIASDPRYIVDSNNGSIKNVTKNRFNSELTLNSAGVLSVNWDASSEEGYEGNANNDIYALLSAETTTSANATAFVNNIFFYPFTFTVRDLVNGNVNVRFRFTSYKENSTTIEKTETVTINAMYLLQTLDIANLQDKFTDLTNFLSDASQRALVTNFSDRLNELCGGIGNEINIFDSFFERIQKGRYQIEYCLLGNSSTFNSAWYTLRRDSQEENNSIFYVNGMPTVTAGYRELTAQEKETTESIANLFYLRISPTSIYNDSNGGTTAAQTYILQLRNNANKYGFEISLIGSDWTCKKIGDDGDAFRVFTDNGDLIIYLNLNGANSLKSAYSDILGANSFTFEIFAKGNEYSFSSKSERFELSFNGACHDFHIENGTFIWQSHQNYPTRVVYKHATSTSETTDNISSTTANLTLSLDTAGEYEYIKFITLGGISGNSIRVDSETYIIEDVYKLANPTLQTDFNMIRITENENNIEKYATAYSDDDFKKYEIYNDVSTNNSSFKITDLNIENQISLYETGSTFYSQTSQDYAYKNTEASATTFHISSLGSTSSFNYELYNSDTDVYIFTRRATSATAYTGILLRSLQSELGAKMLNPIDSNISISNGVVSWTSDNVLGENTLRDGVGLVYKITISFYTTSVDSNGGTAIETDSSQNITRYTAQTQFDISKQAAYFPEQYDYLRITVQAMALNITAEAPISGISYEELVEGGYVSGENLTYNNSSVYILMSNGVYLDNIVLSSPVKEAQILDGKLTWKYDYNTNVNFIVEDENGNVIDGTLTTTQNEDETYTFTFQENVGALNSGSHTLTVYAIQTSQGQNIIKSAGVSVENVVKIPSLSAEDYTISATTISNSASDGSIVTANVEIIDFSPYFDKYTGGIYDTLTLEMRFMDDSSVVKTLTRDSNKVVVFASEEEAGRFDETYLNGINYVIIESSLSYVVQIVGTFNAGAQGDILASDNYNLNLVRPTLDDSFVISYDSITQTFSWPIPQTEEEDLVYVVTVTYNGTTTRTYETTENSFISTIYGDITAFEIAVKFGENALRSTFVDFEGTARFDLFAGGAGTAESPYLIENATQFKNIAYRMIKPTYLNNYLDQEGQARVEGNIFYFQLNNNIGIDDDTLEFNGILFKGTFDGSLNGNEHTITYTSYYTSSSAQLSSTITVTTGRITGINTGDQGAIYNHGLSLFETLGSNSSITNLDIRSNFSSVNTIGNNLLVAGVAITNNGRLSNVNALGLNSNLVIYTSSQGRIGAYAGLVSINNGSIASSALTEDIMLTDTQGGSTRNQYFFVGGLVYTNYGNITLSRINANITLNISNSGDATRHQIAGITVTSGNNSTLYNNAIESTSKISFVASEQNSDEVYVAGISIYCLAQGSNYSGNIAPTNCVSASTTSGSVTVNDEIIPIN